MCLCVSLDRCSECTKRGLGRLGKLLMLANGNMVCLSWVTSRICAKWLNRIALKQMLQSFSVPTVPTLIRVRLHVTRAVPFLERSPIP
jgi:hypothetical protein